MGNAGILRLALKNLWAYRKRLFTSALSVVLGISFLSGSFVFTDTLKGLFADLFTSSVDGIDVQVRQVSEFGGPGRNGGSGPYDNGRAPLPLSLLDDVKKIPGVVAAEAQIQGYAQAINKKKKLVKSGGAPTFGFVWTKDPTLASYKILNGRPPQADNEIVIDRGLVKTTEFKIGDSMEVNTLNGKATYKIVGDATFGSSDSALGASAIFFNENTGPDVLLRKGFAQSFLVRGEKGVNQEKLRTTILTALKDKSYEGKTKLDVVTGKTLKDEATTFLNLVFGFINTFFSAFAVVALFVSIFVISNSFSIVVAQRTKEMAMLRTLGASRTQMVGSTFFEALIVGVVASILGVLGGMLVALGIKALLEAFGGGGLPSSGLLLLPRTAIVGIIVGTLVTVLSAIAPAIRSSRVKPLAALRDSAIDTGSASGKRLYFGLGFLAASVFFLVQGLRLVDMGKFAGQQFDGPLNIGIAAGTAIIAVVFLGPILAKPLAGALGKPWFGWVVAVFGVLVAVSALPTAYLGFKLMMDNGKIPQRLIAGLVAGALLFGIWWAIATLRDRSTVKLDEKRIPGQVRAAAIACGLVVVTVLSPLLGGAGLSLICGWYLYITGRAANTTSGQIARENAIRNPTRTSATALALTIGTALVSAILVLSQSLTQTIRGAVDNALKGDYVVASAVDDTGFPVSVRDQIAGLPGVKATSSLRFETMRYSRGLLDLKARERRIGGIDSARFGELVNLGKVEGSIAGLAKPDTVAVAKAAMKDQGFKLGDTFSPTFGNGRKTTFTIVASYENAEGLGNLYYLADAATINTYVPKKTIDFLYVSTDGKNNKAVEKAADKALEPYPIAEFQSKTKYADAQVASFQQFLAIVNALLFLAIIIAILGIANTLRLSIFERTREIGLLRAVGMSRDQIRSSIRWEAIVVATFGAVMGVILGTGFGAALVRVLGKDGTLKLNVPFPFLVPLTLLASIVGLVAARKPAKDSAGLNILRAIATD